MCNKFYILPLFHNLVALWREFLRIGTVQVSNLTLFEYMIVVTHIL
jgi:hypothetical protein